MKKLDNYDIWNQAFFHLGAKGSPHNPLFNFSINEFFVKGINYSQNDARTFSAFCYWVQLFGKSKLSSEEVIKEINSNPETNKSLLGFYLDLINDPKFSEVYNYAQKSEPTITLHKVREPDPILLKWGIISKPMSEFPEKYLVLDLTKNRIF